MGRADFRDGVRRRREIVYFVLPDRFENGDTSNDSRRPTEATGLTTGFDPTHKGFYHGGDLKGLIARLDYIQGLGATAIWLGPIYKNKPVQGGPGQETRRLSRLLDHRLHRAWIRTSATTPTCTRSSMRRTRAA